MPETYNTHPDQRHPSNTIRPEAAWDWLHEFRPPGQDELATCQATPYGKAILQTALTPAISLQPEIFGLCSEPADTATAIAAAIVHIHAIIAGGSDYQQLDSCRPHLTELLTTGRLRPLEQASLHAHIAITHILGHGHLQLALQALEHAGQASECAGADGQRILIANLRGYCELMTGRIQVAQAIVLDAIHLAPDPASHIVPKLHLQATLGLINTVANHRSDAHFWLGQTIGTPAFSQMPTHIWLICMGHYLLSLAAEGHSPTEIARVADQIRDYSIPEHKYYFQSYLHYALGAAALLQQQPETALFHAETAAQLGTRSQSTVAERTARLLQIQALNDLKRYDQARELLSSHLPDWQQAQANLLLSSGYLELAHLQSANGQTAAAHASVEQARAALPPGEPLPHNLRRSSFVCALEQLTPSPTTTTHQLPRINITTFGEFRVEINGRILYDRDWHGTRSKTLLKALIVLGGYKVSAERLCDLLWPEADGDSARQNLKMTVWRLRRIGQQEGLSENWLGMKHGQISLVREHCQVDSIVFSSALQNWNDTQGLDKLAAALALYQDDFLGTDDSEAWISNHRMQLRSQFLRGSCLLAEKCLGPNQHMDAEAILQKAVQIAPTHERGNELLIRHYLACGYGEQALAAFLRVNNQIKALGRQGASDTLRALVAGIL